MSGFTFSFSGDDIGENLDGENGSSSCLTSSSPPATEAVKRIRRVRSSAFPIVGQEILPPKLHSLDDFLAELPPKIAYKSLKIASYDKTEIIIPRRELWDVRVQLMAEDDEESLKNLGENDIKTGIYEGGFKSWESSSDLVKVLYHRRKSHKRGPSMILELGCGTALPSLFEFQQQLHEFKVLGTAGELKLGLADYNLTVLQLVTLPNVILSWAQDRGMLDDEGELEINQKLVKDFRESLKICNVTFAFFSGGWSRKLISLVREEMGLNAAHFAVIGAETIYSPSSLKSFAEILLDLLESIDSPQKSALVAAKTVYFGVGGTMNDFCTLIRENGAVVELIREDTDGVARAVVEIQLSKEPKVGVIIHNV
ncbi:Histidine protein methyltransferase 1 [Golovinomyces cichoracearum]|uniref:protein-histidine N-methyltransferase n=1 Tax=Golovinomyces cichoracearum TaxID=62708 RepID=A0A420HQI1_9PEZI|nr:Histidine protein methyltransferase 1 [Golovinomyces cichoracearum]